MINHFWPKPLEAEGDIQTANDSAWPEEYLKNQIASIDKNQEDEEDEEVEQQDNDED